MNPYIEHNNKLITYLIDLTHEEYYEYRNNVDESVLIDTYLIIMLDIEDVSDTIKNLEDKYLDNKKTYNSIENLYMYSRKGNPLSKDSTST